MRWSMSAISLLLGGILAFPESSGQAMAAVPELRKVHILVVLDTEASDLASSLRLDEARLRGLWRQTMPADRYSLTLLKGKQVSRESVLAHYRDLQLGPNEGLIFYYGGHGATDPRSREHYFDLASGKPLLRRDVLRAMETRQPALAVLLSDCCSTPKKLKQTVTTRQVYAQASTLHPTVRALFFQGRGTVDITAATDNASWSDNLQGGLFTRSLERLLTAPVKELDSNRDGSIHWSEFYPQLRKETQSLFDSWRKDMTARGETVDGRNQVPHAFEHRQAVVGIENATAGPLAYQVRWPGQQEWTEVTLQPGEQRVHRRLLDSPEAVPPRLEARFSGVRKMQELSAGLWSGMGEPAEPKLYRISPRVKRTQPGDEP